ncbi:putative glyoxal oxidase [Lupinus albus]|uniref:Putative glyoxal oxidase n=1 Tax=Lupinus albus TaxID=3870 RepID=A0A6A4NGZ2_LUPAL|nr:putative glyoxal oxidase [Lupinus albus]
MVDDMLVQSCGLNESEHQLRKQILNSYNVFFFYTIIYILFFNGRQIIKGGQGQFNNEFFPKSSHDKYTYSLPFLVQTYDKFVQNNLYPFIFLNLDGNLYIFAITALFCSITKTP